MSPLKVMIIDDSALMRELLAKLLTGAGLEVVATAMDPVVAIHKLRTVTPDVITLDVEMPRMNGLEFLEQLMALRPLPVVMVSSLTEAGAAATVRALELGAVDFVAKPRLDLSTGMAGMADELVMKLKVASAARVRARPRVAQPAVAVRRAAPPPPMLETTQQVLCLGASTGGTEALKDLLLTMPADAPPIVVVQHMPEKFTRAFAERLDGMTAVKVVEASNGDRLLGGHVYIAPGNFHLRVLRSGASYTLAVESGPPVNRHRPSVDVLFDSAVSALGQNALAALLTGMGNDGAHGLKRLRDAGARTIAQDEATSVVFGMPREAIKLGAAEAVLPLSQIGPTLLSWARARRPAAALKVS